MPRINNVYGLRSHKKVAQLQGNGFLKRAPVTEGSGMNSNLKTLTDSLKRIKISARPKKKYISL